MAIKYAKVNLCSVFSLLHMYYILSDPHIAAL